MAKNKQDLISEGKIKDKEFVKVPGARPKGDGKQAQGHDKVEFR